MTDVDPRGTRVIVADDDVLMREGLASLLERGGYEVVGQAGDGSELMRLVGEQPPDLAVIDIRMPPDHRTEGLEAAQLIREQFPETALLILSAHVEVEHAMTLLASGRRTGYMLKSRVTDVDEFLDAVGRVSRGGSVVDPALVQELVAARDVEDPLEELTRRERDVLALMAEGRSNAGIGRRLWITEGTVEKHVHSILRSSACPRPMTITAGCSPWSGSSTLIRPARSRRLIAVDAASIRRIAAADSVHLRQKPEGRTRLDQVGVLGFVVGRDQDHVRDRSLTRPLAQPAGQLEPAFLAEVDVDQRDIRPQLGDLPKRLGRGRRRPRRHRDPARRADRAFPLGSSRCHRRSGSASGMAGLHDRRNRRAAPLVLAPKIELQGSLPPASVKTKFGRLAGGPKLSALAVQTPSGLLGDAPRHSTPDRCTQHRTGDHGASPSQIFRRSRRGAAFPPGR